MAETIALAKVAAKFVVKIKHRALLSDLQCRQEQETQIKRTCVWVDNTAALAVATGTDFSHETHGKARHCQSSFSSGVCSTQNHTVGIYQDKQKYCRHHDQTIGNTELIRLPNRD
jgi:hypothetical protein